MRKKFRFNDGKIPRHIRYAVFFKDFCQHAIHWLHAEDAFGKNSVRNILGVLKSRLPIFFQAVHYAFIEFTRIRTIVEKIQVFHGGQIIFFLFCRFRVRSAEFSRNAGRGARKRPCRNPEKIPPGHGMFLSFFFAPVFFRRIFDFFGKALFH